MRAYKGIRPVVLMMAVTAPSLLAPLAAQAEQLVLFDTTYEHTGARDSHHEMPAAAINQPADWTAPIDYTQGTIHFYQEVMTKPSNKDTIIDFCLISARDYGCIETFVYTTTGVHETVRSMAGKDVDKRALIDFKHKMKSIEMVLKTPVTYINGGKPQSDFLPSKMRFVATLVPPGSTYVRPTPTPGFALDGGAGPGDAAPAMADAAPSDPGPAPGPGDAAAAPDVPMAMEAGTPSTDPPAPGTTPPMTVADAGTRPPSPPAPSKPPAPKPEPENTPTPSSPAGCALAGAAPPTSATGALALLAGLALAGRARRRCDQS